MPSCEKYDNQGWPVLEGMLTGAAIGEGPVSG